MHEDARYLLTDQGWRFLYDGGILDIVPIGADEHFGVIRLPVWYFSHFNCKLLGLKGDRTFHEPNMLVSALELVQKRKRYCICRALDVVYRSASSPCWFVVRCGFDVAECDGSGRWTVTEVEVQPSGEVLRETFMATALNEALQ